MKTLLKFKRGSTVLQFENGSSYPSKSKIELLQVRDRTAGGDLQVEDLGVKIASTVLIFHKMPKIDYDGLVNFFINVVNGSEFSFEFTDEYGITKQAFFIDAVIDYEEVNFGQFSGSTKLEFV